MLYTRRSKRHSTASPNSMLTSRRHGSVLENGELAGRFGLCSRHSKLRRVVPSVEVDISFLTASRILSAVVAYPVQYCTSQKGQLLSHKPRSSTGTTGNRMYINREADDELALKGYIHGAETCRSVRDIRMILVIQRLTYLY